MDISLKLILLAALCWLLASVFRLLISLIERFIDISSQIHANAQYSEPVDKEVPATPIDKKAA